MNPKEIRSLSAVALGEAIASGKTTAIEATEAVLERIKEKEDTIHAYVTVEKTKALEQAKKVQRKIETGSLTHPLAGVPVAVKDNLCTKGIKTTCGSKILANFVPSYSATAVERLEAAGAVLIGKTNMDEFAMGSTTETSFFGATKNPRNPQYVPGGSSGGSCAALAAEECFFALGSDTGGSIRQPASFCGVTGIKPTYGTVSRYGLIAYASSLDQIGPIGKDVRDCAIALETIAGYDKKDATSQKRESYDFSSLLGENIKGMKIGIPKEYLETGLDKEVKESVLLAALRLKNKGAIVEKFSLGLTEYALPAYYVIASAEASSNLERYDGVKYGYRTEHFDSLSDLYKKTRSEGFGTEVKRRLMLGTFTLSAGYYDAYYGKAQKARALIKQRFQLAFQAYDLLLSPVAPRTAPRLGEYKDDLISLYLSDIYTVGANLAGLPAVSLPCGEDKKGLPIGVQLIGNALEEKKLFQAAYLLEKEQKDENL
jgi:aspartyl-tRNA(Asn)/glutamyl-tRNA(Gln) amidotransferase subunit A